MSLVLKPISIENKNELISLLSGPLKEEPLRLNILDREVGTRESGFADLLVLDADGRLNLVYLLDAGSPAAAFGPLSNYFWACENIRNLKKMYPQVEISAAEPPGIVFAAPAFPDKLRRALCLLRAEPVRALQYKAFAAQGVPCLLLEEISLKEGAVLDTEIARLKKEYSAGSRFLSEEEILEFLRFESKN